MAERVQADQGQQVWEIRRSASAMSAVVSQGDHHRSLSILEWSLSEATCSISFYAPIGALRTDRENIFLGDLLLKVSDCEINYQIDRLCLVRLNLSVDRFERCQHLEIVNGLPALENLVIKIYVADEHHPSQLRLRLEQAWQQALTMSMLSYIPTYSQLFPVGRDFASPVPKLCRGCRNVYGRINGGNLMICAVHPYGNGGHCSDFEAKQ